MQVPDLPADEICRLGALNDLKLLDTDAEERFDRLTRIARRMFEVPIVLVSLVDESRQWFKSRQGLTETETSRDVSFCGHTILDRDILEVRNALLDPRFADNPLVTGPPGVRFYAGAPLETVQGYRIGTLCIIDHRPRSLSPEERLQLRDLADCVAAEINQSMQKAQDLVRETTQRLTAVIEGTNIGTWEWNVQTGQTRFNERWAQIVGYTLAELEPVSIDTWQGLAHPDDLAESARQLQRHFTGELDYYDVICRMRHKQGHWVWVHDRGRVLSWGAAGEPQWMYGTHADITEMQRQLEAFATLNAIASSSSLELVPRLQQALQLGAEYLGLDVGIVSRVRGNDYQIRACVAPEEAGLAIGQRFELNNTYCVMTLRAGELVAIDSMADSPLRGHPCYGAFGLETYIGSAVEVAGQLDGTINFSSVNPRGRPFSDNEKMFLRLLARWVASAVEKDRAIRSIRLNEARLRGLFELSPVGIALNDFDTGAFIEVNDALVASTGYTSAEFAALNYRVLTPREYESRDIEQLKSLEATGRYGPLEKEYIRKDGIRYPVLLNGMLVHDLSGRRLIWSIIEDISERKRMEQMKNEFISTVSHELRTPLTALSGALGLVNAGAAGDVPHSMRNMLQIAQQNSQRLGLLINDLLDMDKLVAGKMQFNLQDQPLMPLIIEALRLNQPYAGLYQVQLHLIPADSDALVRVDAQRLHQVLTNLLSNAVKFSPAGEDITVSVLVTDEKVTLVVADRGVGIPVEFKSRVFQKFSQADSSDQRHKGGTGLGLAICKEIMERMGGDIGFEPRPGGGTRFLVNVPQSHCSQSGEAPTP